MCEFESLSRGRRGGRLTDLSNYLYKGLVDMELNFICTTILVWPGRILIPPPLVCGLETSSGTS